MSTELTEVAEKHRKEDEAMSRSKDKNAKIHAEVEDFEDL